MNPSQSFNKQLYEWVELIKLEHTVFALPFALSGFILASKGPPHIDSLLWTIVAFTGARTAAMSLNRVIDAEIDSRNPKAMLFGWLSSVLFSCLLLLCNYHLCVFA
jgi:4-hydroxybenzoate polyprenyltransferase